MSGGDRSGGGGGGGSNGGSECGNLMVRTIISSPVPRILSALKKDDVLTVELFVQGSHPIVVVRSDDGIAGSVTYSGVAKLIGCIGDGWKYIALVIGVDGGECEIEIRPKGRR